MVWEFLTQYLPTRRRSLLEVADRRGFGELARLWLSGIAVPHLGLKDQARPPTGRISIEQ